MDSVIESKIKNYCAQNWHYKPLECGVILERITVAARAAGFEVDERFAQAGLGAGPEARVASAIVDLALGGGGAETSDDTIRRQIHQWLITTAERAGVR